MQINADMDLYKWDPGQGPAGYASGGFMADVHVTGKTESGSQQ